MWPRAPYIHSERLANATFEELYPVEHLATLFRFCEELMSDCKKLFKKKDAALICEALEFQLKSTRRMLEGAGYYFLNSLDCRRDVPADRIVSIVEHNVWE